jgi:hypothetical protein
MPSYPLSPWRKLARSPQENAALAALTQPSQEQVLAQQQAAFGETPPEAPAPAGPSRPIPTMEKGSGQSWGLEMTADELNNLRAQKLNMMNPSQLAAAAKNIIDLPAYQDQEKGINKFQDLIALESKNSEPQMDWSPLVALTDSQTGSNLAKGYKAPDNAGNRKRVLDYISKIQDDRRDLLKSIVSGVSAQKAGFDVSQTQTKNQTQETIKAQDPAKSEKTPSPGSAMADKRTKEMFTMKTINEDMKPFEQMADRLATLHSALAQNDLQSVQATLSIIAKSIGADSGMLSNQDIARTMPPTLGLTLANFDAFFNDNPNAALKPEITAGLRKLANIAFERGEARYSQSLARKKAEVESTWGPGFGNIFVPSEKRALEIKKFRQGLVDEDTKTNAGIGVSPADAAKAAEKKAVQDKMDRIEKLLQKDGK